MEPAPTLEQRERLLLTLATGLGGLRRLPELAAALRPAFALAPGPALGGLAIQDEERGLCTLHALDPAGGALAPQVLSAAQAAPLRRGEDDAFALRTESLPEGALRALLDARGVARLVAAPLRFDRRRLGLVLIGERAGAAIPELEPYLEPHVWNCFIEERFERGDRRRDALWELSRVINTSLDPGVVLHLARQAVGRIAGHRASWIGLLEPDGASWRRYDRPQDYRGDEREPAPQPVAGSVIERLLGEERAFASPDLAETRRHREDEELFALGLRRYVATSLHAGGKTLGGFLFATDDPHPPLEVDLWLLENIALQIALAIDNAQHHQELQRLSMRREQQNAYLREEIAGVHGAGGMIGRSPAMRAVFEKIARVAGTGATVLVCGPTGVGKELVARAIHEASRVREQPMVKLNCAAIPEGMVESELFGHERGAFTSAHDRRIGRFELANQGTLFLDEVGELPLGVQAKLLRVLQSGEFERVGGTKTLTTNARIVAATNRHLEEALAAGTFRSDLYYRLNVFPIDVPALDERREDIPLLVEAFVDQLARRMGKRFEGVEPASMERLCRRAWPGNVRELRHFIERAVILCDGPLLSVDDSGAPPAVAASGAARSLEEVEAEHIRATLARTGGVIEGPRGAAQALGLKPSTLRFRMKRLGVGRPGAG